MLRLRFVFHTLIAVTASFICVGEVSAAGSSGGWGSSGGGVGVARTFSRARTFRAGWGSSGVRSGTPYGTARGSLFTSARSRLGGSSGGSVAWNRPRRVSGGSSGGGVLNRRGWGALRSSFAPRRRSFVGGSSGGSTGGTIAFSGGSSGGTFSGGSTGSYLAGSSTGSIMSTPYYSGGSTGSLITSSVLPSMPIGMPVEGTIVPSTVLPGTIIGSTTTSSDGGTIVEAPVPASDVLVSSTETPVLSGPSQPVVVQPQEAVTQVNATAKPTTTLLEESAEPAKPVEPESKEPNTVEQEPKIDSEPEPDARRLPSTLKVNVPQMAIVYVNGVKTNTTGSKRTYQTPKLLPNLTAEYEIRAEIVQSGKPLSITKTVSMIGGQTHELDFDFPTPEKELVTSLKLNVPEDAQVSLGGVETNMKGTKRVFETNRLGPGQGYFNYKVVVLVKRNGETISKEETVNINAGESKELNFEFPSNEAQVAANN